MTCADGHFSIMYARPDLPKIASNDPMKPTPEEANAITLGSVAYFGTYTVDEGSKTISFRIESSTIEPARNETGAKDHFAHGG